MRGQTDDRCRHLQMKNHREKFHMKQKREKNVNLNIKTIYPNFEPIINMDNSKIENVPVKQTLQRNLNMYALSKG